MPPDLAKTAFEELRHGRFAMSGGRDGVGGFDRRRDGGDGSGERFGPAGRPTPGKVPSTSLIGHSDPPGWYQPSPGKRTHTMRIPGSDMDEFAVQRKADGAPGAEGAADAAAIARGGVDGAGGSLPHGDAIQRSFGSHDVSGVRAHSDVAAASAAGSLGARAYTIGDRVAFRGGADLHTAAHEAAHVVQQRVGASRGGLDSGTGDPMERHADRVADAVTRGESAEPLLDELGSGGGPSSAVQRDSAPAAPAVPAAPAAAKGQTENAVIARLSQAGSAVANEGRLLSTTTIGIFEDEAHAIATAKSRGQPGVVIPENGKFVLYGATSNYTVLFGNGQVDILNSVFFQNAGVFPVAGFSALVSVNGMVHRPGDFGKMPQRLGGPEKDPGADPFKPYKEIGTASGGGKLENLKEEEFLGIFQAAMKDAALKVLVDSERKAADKEKQFSAGGNAVSQSEDDQMVETAKELRKVLGEIRESEAAERLAKPRDHPMYDTPVSGNVAEWLAAQNRTKALKEKRARVVARYPMLGRYQETSDIEKLDAFISKGKEHRAGTLAGDAKQVLADIARTRQAIVEGQLNLWCVPSVVNTTIAGLGLGEGNKLRTVALDKAKSEKTNELLLGIALAVFSIGFGIAALFATGPAALALTAGAFGLGLYDAAKTTEEHFITNAATNTDLNQTDALVDPETRMHWGWLVVAWTGVALDFADVLKAARIGEEIGKISKGARTLDEAAQALAAGNAEVLARLRKAAGVHKIDDAISVDVVKALEPQVGARIEIDAARFGEKGGEVRVMLDEAGKVSHIVAGPAAKVGDVLMHTETVRLLKRYDGMVGKIRELWDRFRSFAGKGDPNLPPPSFKAGSEELVSWHEVKKLHDIRAVKRAQLDELMASGAPQAQQSALRRDIAFLENEYDIHRRVLDRVPGATNAGADFIAFGEGTRRALEAGFTLPDKPHLTAAAVQSMDPEKLTAELKSSKYAYRTDASQHTLLAKGDAPQLDPEIVDGKFTGKFVPKGSGRVARAEELIKSWPEELQKAYNNLDVPGRKVPVKGLTSIGTSIAQLDPTFVDRCRAILQPAYLRLFDGDMAKARPAAMETAQALATHPLTLVHGTEHIRAATGYRTLYLKGLAEAGTKAAEDAEIHHLIPLYLGGSHLKLLDLEPKLHSQMHELVDAVRFGEGTLAPASIRNLGLPIDKGMAVVQGGAVTLYRAVERGSSWSLVLLGPPP